MLKRLSSLILAVVISGSVLAGTARPSNEHFCKMAGMQMSMALASLSPSRGMMPGMEMPPDLHLDHDMEAMPGMKMTPDMHMDHVMEAMPGMEMTPDMHMDHDMEAMPGAEPMPCCKKHTTQRVVSEPGFGEQCCVNIPQEPGSSGTPFNLRSPSFSIDVIHPAIVQSPIILPKPYECSYSPQVFLPNLQSSYIRNLSLLI